jgi:hypothetical protein
MSGEQARLSRQRKTPLLISAGAFCREEEIRTLL